MLASPSPTILFASGAAIAVVLVLLLLVGGGILWLVFGPGPRRARAWRQAAQLANQGQWHEALQIVRGVRAAGSQQASWQHSWAQFEGQCLQTGAEASLREKRFEEGLNLYRQAAPLLGTNEQAVRDRVLDAMMSEARLQFAAGPAATGVVRDVVQRALAIQPNLAEAQFWKALCEVREGRLTDAVTTLESAHQFGNKQFIDPPLYLGALLYRQQKPQEALRVLAEATRVDSNCPIVAWQLGLAMVAAGSDGNIAIRVLQKALGNRGLQLWLPTPHRAWVEAFPKDRSFIRRLAEHYAYPDPILGTDIRQLIRQGEMAVATAQYRMGNYQEASDLYSKVLQESPPTLPVLRGLGMSLTRLERYDQAFKHLRAALEMDPGHVHTAAYFALCGARGKPTQPEDKARNVAWGIQQMARLNIKGDHELTGVMSAIHAEARGIDLAQSREDQVRLCELLAAIKAHDAEAAAAYDQLAREYPDAVAGEYAWLYAQAAVKHGARGAADLGLLARVFRDRAGSQDWFAKNGWSLEEVEYTYLDRFGSHSPGRFPEVMGGDYPPRGEAFLLERSTRLEKEGKAGEAMQAVEVLRRLSPRSVAAHDRAACLHYRLGDFDAALQSLGAWHQLDPSSALPVLRRAVIEQQKGDNAACRHSIHLAMALARGAARASVAFLGSRLVLAGTSLGKAADAAGDGEGFAEAERLLLECLKEQPGHTVALWCLAALRSVKKDEAGLASLAPMLDKPEATDPRFHYLAAVTFLAAGQLDKAVEAAKKAGADQTMGVEAKYLLAWAHLLKNEPDAARQPLQEAAAGSGPSADHARALLGRLCLLGGEAGEAVRWWNQTDPAKRAAWQIDEPLRLTIFLAGLEDMDAGRFEEAAERFREAGKLGLRDKRLGSLISLSLFKAGQKLLFETDAPVPVVMPLSV